MVTLALATGWRFVRRLKPERAIMLAVVAGLGSFQPAYLFLYIIFP
ncbi:MAG: hypothetical protein ABIP55_08255 [Tepidisphaeraceae bacterium]